MRLIKIVFILSLTSFIFGEIIRIPIVGVEIKFLDLSVLILFTYWVLYSVKRKRISKIVYPPAVIFACVGLASLLLNTKFLNLSEFFVSLLYLIRWISYVGLFYIVLNFDKNFKDKLKDILVILGFVVVIVGYVQLTFYQNLRNLFYLGWDEHLYRMFSVFLDPNFAGAFFVLFFLFLLNLIFENLKDTKKLLIYSIISILTFFAILLTYSRSAFIMLLAGVCLFLILKKKPLVIGLVVLGLVLTTLILPRAYQTEGTNFLRLASSEARIASARQAADIFTQNPVFGVGFNALRYAKQKYGYGPTSFSHADAGTDNSFLFVLVTTGVVGFISFISMWFKILKENKNSALILSSIAALFIGSLFVNSLFYSLIMYWIWIILGLRENGKIQKR